MFTSVALTSADAPDLQIGCCVDPISGCRNVFSIRDAQVCEAQGFEYQEGVSCFPIPSRPDIPVTENPLCMGSGCCCFGDSTYTSGLLRSTCENQNGIFRVGQDCSAVCGVFSEPGTVTCEALNGFWCADGDAPRGGSVLPVTDFSTRPSGSQCYDMPCTTQTCPPGEFTYEVYCADGRDNSGNCLVDTLDPDCSNALRGVIRNPQGNPVSNVRVRIVNNLVEQGFPRNEEYITYSVRDGEFFFQGMSFGYYTVFIDDPFFDQKEPVATFMFDRNNMFRQGLSFTAIPKNAISFSGRVIDETTKQPIEGATVLVRGTTFTAITNVEGTFSIENVPRETYDVVAYKQGYAPRTQRERLDGSEVVIELSSYGCDVQEPVPNLINATNVRGVSHIRLGFEDTGCSPSTFIVLRCNADLHDCSTSGFSQIATISGRDTSFIDTTTQWNTTYVYALRATYPASSGGSTRVSANSNTIEIFSGDFACAGRSGDAFCEYTFDRVGGERVYRNSAGYVCNAQNQKVPRSICTGDSKCIETTNNGVISTSCRALDVCDPLEDNVFGLFFDRQLCQGPSNDRFCVFDASTTNVDNCFSCAVYTSCFDYRTRDACTQNQCGVGSCEWVPTSGDFNAGVCVDTSKSTCEDCNDPFNAIFGTCDENACDALGVCNFDTRTNYCASCSLTSCYDYSSRDTCGTNSRTVLNPATNEVVITPDSCELGICIWDIVSQQCLKDANADGQDDCQDFEQVGDYTIDHCRADTLPPETAITLSTTQFNPEINPLEINFIASDSVNGVSRTFPVAATYFCIEPEGSNRCRSTRQHYDTVPTANNSGTITIDAMSVSPGESGRIFNLAPGRNTIKFYSKDFSNNLEIVKQESFVIDLSPPVVDVSYSIVPNYDTRTSSVTILANANKEVLCYAQTANCETTGTCDSNFFSNVSAEYLSLRANSFDRTYFRTINNLPDGFTQLKTVCIDRAGNIFESEEGLRLQADSRIFDSMPEGATDKTSVTLEAYTATPVECRFGTNIQASFTSMSPMTRQSQTRDSGEEVFRHTAQVSGLASRTHTYYVRCNFEPVALEEISFTVDTIAPTVELLLDERFPYNGEWIDRANIGLICNDEPEFGFGCEKVEYCRTTIEGLCTPDTEYTSSFNLNSPATICFRAFENSKEVNGEVQGGRRTDIICEDIFVDTIDPVIVVNRMPSVTNQNHVQITGFVYDGSTALDVSFSDVTSDFRTLFDTKEYEGFFTESSGDIIVTLDFSSASEKTGLFKIVLGSSSNYDALVFNFDAKEIQLGSRRFTGFQIQDRFSVYNSFFETPKTVLISRTNNQLQAKIIDTQVSNLVDLEMQSNLGHSQVGFVRTTNAPVTLKNPAVIENDIYPKRIFTYINNEIREVVTTTRDFSFSIPLSQGTPFHGATYDVIVFARDLAGRTSDHVEQRIQFDASGPIVTNVEVLPLENEGNYVEYGTDATLRVRAVDEFGVRSVIAQFGPLQRRQEVTLTQTEIGSDVWEATIPTRSLPIGTFSLDITTTDLSGNTLRQEFPGAIVIDDRIAPSFIINTNSTFYNSQRPVFSFKTDEETSCIAFDNQGGEIYRSQGFSRDHAFTIEFNSEEIANVDMFTKEITLECRDRNDNMRDYVFDITYDIRPPVYTIKTDTQNLIPRFIQRHTAEYISLFVDDFRFYFEADEPVTCRIGTFDTPGFQTSGQSSEFLVSSELTVNAYCKDRAGNVGQEKTVKIVLDRSAPLHLFNLQDSYVTNVQEAQDITFRTIRDTSCSYSINGGSSSTIQKTSSSPNQFDFRIPANVFPQGTSEVTIQCGSISKEVMYYNDATPPMVSNFQGRSTSSPEIPLSVSFSEEVVYSIYVNEILSLKGQGSSLSGRVYGKPGRNAVTIRMEDLAGNIRTHTDFFIVPDSASSYTISNFIPGSTQDSLQGILTTEAQSPSLRIQGSTIQLESIGSDQYAISIPRTRLLEIIGLSEQQFSQMSVSEIKPVPLQFEIVSNGNTFGSFLFIFDPFAESISMQSPKSQRVTESDIVNGNIGFEGRFIQENYIDTTRLFLPATNAVRPLERSHGIFTQSLPIRTEYFDFSARNDLRRTTRIFAPLLLDLQGPMPFVSINPEGDITYTANTEFLVTFLNRAQVTEAIIFNEDFSSNQSISALGGRGFSTILRATLPSPGTYHLRIAAQSEDGKTGGKTFTFRYVEAPFTLTVAEPKYMVSPTQEYNIVLESSRSVICRYAGQDIPFDDMIVIGNSPSRTHTISAVGSKNIVVKCSLEGVVSEIPYRFSFTTDSVAPSIERIQLAGGNEIKEYPLQAVFTITANKEVFCKYAFDDASYDDMVLPTKQDCPSLESGELCFNQNFKITIPNLENNRAYTARFICEGKSGLQSNPATAEFRVALRNDGAISFNSPRQFEGSLQVLLSVDTKHEETCTFGVEENAVTQRFTLRNDAGLQHNATITFRGEGNHTLYVACGEFKTSRTFFIDTTPPVPGIVNATKFANGDVEIRFNNFNDPESGIARYEYAIGVAPGSQQGWNSLLNWTPTTNTIVRHSNLTFRSDTTYYVNVRALN
ncbi:MAG: carboxypeptidase regulatory-like domain-containing protein, partial [Candidatus Woesearchaeota archaeon]